MTYTICPQRLGRWNSWDITPQNNWYQVWWIPNIDLGLEEIMLHVEKLARPLSKKTNGTEYVMYHVCVQLDSANTKPTIAYVTRHPSSLSRFLLYFFCFLFLFYFIFHRSLFLPLSQLSCDRRCGLIDRRLRFQYLLRSLAGVSDPSSNILKVMVSIRYSSV